MVEARDTGIFMFFLLIDTILVIGRRSYHSSCNSRSANFFVFEFLTTTLQYIPKTLSLYNGVRSRLHDHKIHL